MAVILWDDAVRLALQGGCSEPLCGVWEGVASSDGAGGGKHAAGGSGRRQRQAAERSRILKIGFWDEVRLRGLLVASLFVPRGVPE